MAITEEEKHAVLKQFMAKAIGVGTPYQESLDIVKNAGEDFKNEVLDYLNEAIDAIDDSKQKAIDQFEKTKGNLLAVKEDIEAL